MNVVPTREMLYPLALKPQDVCPVLVAVLKPVALRGGSRGIEKGRSGLD
jgi:hypothetical protein